MEIGDWMEVSKFVSVAIAAGVGVLGLAYFFLGSGRK